MPTTTKKDLPTLALAPSESEQQKAGRTHRAIRKHLEKDPSLAVYTIDTYLQGSYKNSTNVRGDSDVDMGSVTDRFFYYDLSDLPDDPANSVGAGRRSLRQQVEASIVPTSMTFSKYRSDVLASLQSEYGRDAVVDGNKAIRVNGNTYRLDADVLPCTTFRWYYKDWRGGASYHTGISFFTNNGERVVNFPHQHFTNLSQKDQTNSGKVKGCIRILKRVRNELVNAGGWDRKRSPSYYLEGLLWNVPDDLFRGGYTSVFPNVLKYLWEDLTAKRGREELRSYMQANNVFVLFHQSFWNVNDAIDFIEAIWQAVYE